MKSLKNLTLIMTMIVALSVSHNVHATELSKIKAVQLEKVQNVMDRAVDFPQDAREQNITGTVKAKLAVTVEGKIEVEEINGHPELREYVSAQLKNVTIDDISLTGKTFIAKFDFRN